MNYHVKLLEQAALRLWDGDGDYPNGFYWQYICHALYDALHYPEGEEHLGVPEKRRKAYEDVSERIYGLLYPSSSLEGWLGEKGYLESSEIRFKHSEIQAVRRAWIDDMIIYWEKHA